MFSKFLNISDFLDERTENAYTLQPKSTTSKPKIIFRAWSHPPYPDHPASLAYTDPLPPIEDFGVDDGLKTSDNGYGQDVDLFSDDVIVGTPPSVSGCAVLEVGNWFCQTYLAEQYCLLGHPLPSSFSDILFLFIVHDLINLPFSGGAGQS